MNMRRSSSATWLALCYLGLVVYASLYPFGPWAWPPTLSLRAMLTLPWPRYWLVWDIWVNVLGYVPLGLLLCAAVLRSGGHRRTAVLLGVCAPALLSHVMETLQFFLAGRAPSLADWLLNSAGALLGTVLAGLLLHFGVLQRWQGWRERLFAPRSSGAIALLALWPVGLLFPTPLLLGVGQWLPRLRALSEAALAGTPWALQSDVDVAVASALPPGQEAIAIALGLLGPTLLALAVTLPGLRRVIVVLGALALGVVVTTLSTALNFGPQHAWAWITPATWPGLGVGVLLGLLATLMSRRAAAAWGLVALSALIAMVSGAPTDPFLSQILQTWEQGRFINLYGLAQWVGWCWPFAAVAWLLWRVGQKQD
ncbi:MAG TPA: VanZ family protein [Burkholderiaceae bacterium]